MAELIDLSQEIYQGMPVFRDMPEVRISMHRSHEQWEGIENPPTHTPAALKLELGEHSGSHVDAFSHMGKEYSGQSIDRMPLEMFYTEAFCLDFSYKGLRELINRDDIEGACKQAGQHIKKGDTLLLYTDHYRRYYQTEHWGHGPGITADAARWLGEKKLAAFGVETLSPGVSGVSNKEVHRICGELGFTHYENLVNLHLLINRGRFRFIGLPLKIRGGTGSPVRAVAVFE
jgi:kynurenine formamidase